MNAPMPLCDGTLIVRIHATEFGLDIEENAMFSIVRSLPFSLFAICCLILIGVFVYYLIKEKGQKKIYTPILYVNILGVMVLLAYKCTISTLALSKYIPMATYILYAYLGVFLLCIYVVGFIALDRKNDPKINKSMIKSGMTLLAICILFFLFILIKE